MATRCTEAEARRRVTQLAPLVLQGLKVREIQDLAAKNPKLAWVGTLSPYTLRRYLRRINDLPVDSAPLRAAVVAEILRHLDDTRRQLDALETALKRAGVADG